MAGLSFAEAVAAAGVSIERALVPGFAALDAAEALGYRVADPFGG